ncbi:MAG: hypothetical protein Aurels2KO_16220 [Aureliella sp.]
MGKFWSLLFLAVPVLGSLCNLAGMLTSTGPLAHWLPKISSCEVVCAEKCGWGHYKMKGRLVVDSLKDHTAYIDSLISKHFQRSYSGEYEAERVQPPLATRSHLGKLAGGVL